MDITATAKFIRVSPRKMTLLARGIRPFTPTVALARLAYIPKSGTRQLQKVIAAAVADANQKNIKSESLIFKQITVTPGGAFKRFRAVSRGMAHEYKKRMSHVKVVLTEKITEKKIPASQSDKTLLTSDKSNPKSK